MEEYDSKETTGVRMEPAVTLNYHVQLAKETLKKKRQEGEGKTSSCLGIQEPRQ